MTYFQTENAKKERNYLRIYDIFSKIFLKLQEAEEAAAAEVLKLTHELELEEAGGDPGGYGAPPGGLSGMILTTQPRIRFMALWLMKLNALSAILWPLLKTTDRKPPFVTNLTIDCQFCRISRKI